MMISWFVLTLLSLGKGGRSAIVTIYPGAQEYYTQLRDAQDGYANNDPLASYSEDERLEVCRDLTKARIYVAIPEESTFPEPEPIPDMDNVQAEAYGLDGPEHRKQPYKELDSIRSQNPYEFVSGIMCAVHGNVTWYLTYGFKADFKFLLEIEHDAPGDRGMDVIGQLEPTPSIDRYYGTSNQKELEKLYLDNINDGQSSSNPLCSLDGNQQFRLCSLVYDAYNQAYPFHDDTLKSFVKIRYNSCSNLTVTLAYKHKENQNQNKKEVQVLPCAVNQEWDGPPHLIFYLAADPRNTHSVFAIRYNITRRDHRFFAYVTDLTVL